MNWTPKIIYGSVPTTITFPYPPDGDPLGEELDANTDDFTSNLGNNQVQYNFTATLYSMTFTYLDLATVTALRLFFNSWAKKGNTFSYYPSSDDSTFMTVFLTTKKFKPVRQLADGSGDFLYKLDWSFQSNDV